MRTATAIALLFVATGLSACEGSEVRRPLSTDARFDAETETEVDETDDDVADGDDGDDGDEVDTDTAEETEADVAPNNTLEFWFVGRGGELGRGFDDVTLLPEDEPEAYVPSAGFQIDVRLETTGVNNGEEVTFYVGDFIVGTAEVIVEDDIGAAAFAELMLPDSGTFVVRVETIAANGDALVASKTVTIEPGRCVIQAALVVGPEGCVELDPDAVQPPFQAAIVQVTRVEGPCDRVSGTAQIGNSTVTLAQQPFDADGVARLIIPMDPSTTFVGDIEVDVTALHPTDSVQDQTISVSARFDGRASLASWVEPAADVTQITVADDLDLEPSNGVDIMLRIAVDATPSDVTSATLTVDGNEVGTGEATGDGEIDFGVFTFLPDFVGTVELSVVTTDTCGNTSTFMRKLAVDTTTTTIAIVAPSDDTVLLAADDGDAATPTIYETSFVVRADAPLGAEIEILCADVSRPEVAATVVGGGVVDGPGPFTIDVAVNTLVVGQVANCFAVLVDELVASQPVRVTFAIPAPTLVVVEPTLGACIPSDVATISGTSNGLVGQVLTLSGAGPNPADGPIDELALATVAADGTWSGTYPLADDGTWSFSVAGVDVFGNRTTDTFNVVADRVAPTFVVTAPATTIDSGTVLDEDPVAVGYQATIAVTVTEATTPAGQVCAMVNGGAEQCVAMAATVGFAATLETGANTIVITGRDGCGNAGETITYTVSLTHPNPIAIIAPVSGTLLAAGDFNPSTTTVYERSVIVEVPLAPEGASLIFECRPEGGSTFTVVGGRGISAVAADGRYEVGVSLDVATLGTNIECRARIDLPTPASSAIIGYVIGLPAPSLTLTAPVAGACVRTDIAATGAATNLAGRTVTAALVSGATPVASGTGTADATTWAATVALGTVADGSYSVAATATDTFGNPATANVAIVVDRTAPVVTLTAPVSPDLTFADDSSPDAGMQIDVVITYTEVRAANVCLAVGAAAAVCLPGAASVTFADVTLQPGDNTLTFTATDTCGNAMVPLVATRNFAEDAPVVTITTPAANLTTAATTIDIVVTVTDPELVALPGATVTLSNGATLVPITPTNTAGTYTFEDVPLTAGAANSFTATAAQGSGPTATSQPRIVTQKNATPTIAITTPTTGTNFVVASAECQAGQGNCVTTVAATTTNAEDTSAATLTVTCGGAPAVYNAAVTGNAVSFTNVVLTNQQSCTLVPGVTDLAQQTATGATVTVSVDRTAPTIVITAPDGSLQTSDDADNVTAGLQAALTATVGGVAAGATVTAVITWNNGAAQSKTLTHVVATTTADGGSYLATFADAATPGLVTWDDGLVTVAISVVDVSGNSTTTTLVVAVDLDASIRIIGPATIPADACGGGCAAGTTCTEGQCWVSWGINASRQIVAFVAGVSTTTDNVRVCSDAPSLAATSAPLCTSAASPTGPYREVRRVGSTGGNTIIDLVGVLPETHQRLVAEVLPVANGTWVSSLASVSVNDRLRRVQVDLQTPTIASITSPSDTLAPIGTLNAAEQAAAPRAYDITFTASEAGRAEVYVNGSVAVTQDVSAGATTVRVTLPEGNPQVWVVLRDAVGNASLATPGLGAVTYQPIVDVTAPTLAFTRPNQTPLRIGDNLDITLTSNAEGRIVTLFDNAAEVTTGVISGGSVTFADGAFDILVDGSHTLAATITDAAGNSASAATTPATILVDLVPPSGTIITPPNGDIIIADADDVAPGFQVSVTFATTAGATSWSLSSANCTALFASCEPAVVRASGPVTNAGGNEPATLITLALDGNIDNQRIILTTTDAAGNTHTAQADVNIAVTCAISFQNLPASGWYNTSVCDTPGGCASADVTIEVAIFGLCGILDELVLSDGSGGEYTTTPDAPSFLVTVTNGAALAFEVVANNSGNTVVSTGVVPVDVDLQAPTVAFIASTVGGFATPAQGTTVTWDFADDLDPNAAGMQFNAAVQVTDANAADGAITTLTAAGSSTVALTPTNGTLPITLVGGSPITRDLLGMTVADDQTHVISVTAIDAAGNSGTSTFTATVDVTAPAPVTITDVAIDRRRPRFDVSWTAIADGGVLPQTYEIRYTLGAPIATEDDWDAACLGSDVYGSDPMPAPAAAGQTMTAAIGGPDTRSNSNACRLDVRFDDATPDADVVLRIAVRALDADGDWSTLAAPSVYSVTHAELANGVSLVRFDNSANVFGNNGALLTRRGSIIGDVTGDGIADWTVFLSNANGFCVMRGLASQPAITTISTLSGPDHTCLLGGAAFFNHVNVNQAGHHVASVGDINGDGLGDFGMSGRLTTGSGGVLGEGYVVVYFGKANALPDLTNPNLRFRGISIGLGGTFGNDYSGFCGTGDFDGAAGATDDLVITEPFINRVHVIPGRTSWTASTSLQVHFYAGQAVPPEVYANDVLEMWTVQTATNSWGSPGSPPIFGFRCAPAGDVLPTPAGLGTGVKDDLLIHQSGSNDARIFVVPGRSFTANTVVSVSEAPVSPAPDTEDGRTLRLRQEATGIVGGFGSSLQGNVDLNNDGVPDVIVGHSPRRTGAPGGDGKSLYIFDGGKLAALAGQDVRVTVSGSPIDDTWGGTNGFVINAPINPGIPYAVRAIGDWDGWETGGEGTIDIAFGDAAGLSAFLKLNHFRAPGIALGQFPVLDGEVVNQYRPVGGSIGTWVDGDADLTGDGLPDFITGSNFGDVLIVH